MRHKIQDVIDQNVADGNFQVNNDGFLIMCVICGVGLHRTDVSSHIKTKKHIQELEFWDAWDAEEL